MLEALKTLHLSLRFGLELWGLYALGSGGTHLTKTFPMKVLLGAGLPLLAAVIWGVLVSPKAAYPLALPARLAVEAAIFGSAALLLFLSDRPAQAAWFVALAVVNGMFLHVWRL